MRKVTAGDFAGAIDADAVISGAAFFAEAAVAASINVEVRIDGAEALQFLFRIPDTGFLRV